jgi:hypothetical protein
LLPPCKNAGMRRAKPRRRPLRRYGLLRAGIRDFPGSGRTVQALA